MSELQFAHLEFRAETADPAVIAASIRRSGCAMIRNVLPGQIMDFLADVMPFLFKFIGLNETYANYDPAEATEPPKRREPPLTRFDVLPAYSAMVEIDAIRPFLKCVDRSMLPGVGRAYFNGRIGKIELSRSMARHQARDRPANALPFHQDGANYAEYPFLNFWIPITPAGGDAPGLELAPVGLTECMELTTGPSEHPLIELDETSVMERFGADALFRPVMKPGDVLVMNEHTIHRTHIPLNSNRDRYSIELRVRASEEDEI